MAITISIYDRGTDGSAKKFAEEMVASGVGQAIRSEEENLRYNHNKF